MGRRKQLQLPGQGPARKQTKTKLKFSVLNREDLRKPFNDLKFPKPFRKISTSPRTELDLFVSQSKQNGTHIVHPTIKYSQIEVVPPKEADTDMDDIAAVAGTNGISSKLMVGDITVTGPSGGALTEVSTGATRVGIDGNQTRNATLSCSITMSYEERELSAVTYGMTKFDASWSAYTDILRYILPLYL